MSYIFVQDSDGCRHLIRKDKVEWVSDTDAFQDEALLMACGRTIHVATNLDRLRSALFSDAGELSANHHEERFISSKAPSA